MRLKMTRDELSRAAEVQHEGILLDGEVLEEMQAAHKGLSLLQHPGLLETSVFELDRGGTGYMMDIAIENDSERVIRGMTPRLEMPWRESNFRWLVDPRRKAPPENSYSLPDPGPGGFDPEIVLNHRLGSRSILYPGDSLEGLLFGVGSEPIPAEYENRQRLQSRLSIFDGRGNRYDLNMKFLVTRARPVMRRDQETARRTRERLFASDIKSRMEVRAA